MNLEDFEFEGKKVKIEQNGKNVTLSAFIKGNESSTIEGEVLTKEELQTLRIKFLGEVSQNNESQAMNFAAQLMMKAQYKQTIAYYSAIAIQYPVKQGLCESQIGAAYYFLGDYTQAIEYYVQARENGMNPDMMDDNIWEACETIYQKTNQLNAIALYLKLCPEGNYAKDAKILLE
jgi:tetratricopeptide (TPR) repeat protein